MKTILYMCLVLLGSMSFAVEGVGSGALPVEKPKKLVCDSFYNYLNEKGENLHDPVVKNMTTKLHRDEDKNSPWFTGSIVRNTSDNRFQIEVSAQQPIVSEGAEGVQASSIKITDKVSGVIFTADLIQSSNRVLVEIPNKKNPENLEPEKYLSVMCDIK